MTVFQFLMFCSYFYYSNYLSELRISLQNTRNTDFTRKVANLEVRPVLLKQTAYSKVTCDTASPGGEPHKTPGNQRLDGEQLRHSLL